MLSHQSPFPVPGRHRRQNSTPTGSDAQKTLHRRGLSLDQPGHTQQHHGLSPLDEMPTSVEYLLGQQLTQTVMMREAQQQPMARPGLNQDIMQRLIEENALEAEQTTSRPERATEAFGNNRHTTQFTESIHETLHLPRLARDTEAFSMDCYVTPITNLDNHTYLSPRPERSTETISNKYHSTETTFSENDLHQSLQNTYENNNLLLQPCTPPSQTRTSQYKS